MKLFSSKIKKLLYFLKKMFSYISGNTIFKKKLLIFQERAFQACKIKTHSEKIPYILRNGTF